MDEQAKVCHLKVFCKYILFNQIQSLALLDLAARIFFKHKNP